MYVRWRLLNSQYSSSFSIAAFSAETYTSCRENPASRSFNGFCFLVQRTSGAGPAHIDDGKALCEPHGELAALPSEEVMKQLTLSFTPEASHLHYVC